MSPDNDTPAEFADLSPKIINRIKWILYFLAWAVVIIHTACNHPEDLQGFFAFPVGFYGFLEPKTSMWTTFLGAWPAIVVGWGLYSVLAVAMRRAKRIWVYLILYSVFCVLLALNLVGCRRIIETAAGIH
jgi:hypothetical protein